MFGTPAQWAAAGHAAAADAFVERVPDPAVAVRILLSLAAVSDSAERRLELLLRAGQKAASVERVVPRGLAAIAVTRAAVAASAAGVVQEIAANVEPGLALHLQERCAVELARCGGVRQAHAVLESLPAVRRDRAFAAVSAEEARLSGDPEVARALAEQVAGDPARVAVLLAGGLVDEALTVPLATVEMDAVGIEKADIARTELAVALSRRGDFDQAFEVIARISGPRRRHYARLSAARAAAPLPGAMRFADLFSDWSLGRYVGELAARVEDIGSALALAEASGRRTEVLRKFAVVMARRGMVPEAMELVDDLEPDTVSALELAEAVAGQGDRDIALAMLTDPAICMRYDFENPPPAYDVVPGARAAGAHGELAHALAAVEFAREWDKGAVRRKAARAAAIQGHPRTALALVAGIDSEEGRRHQTAAVLAATAARGDLSDALALLDEHVPLRDQLYTLVVIGRGLVRAGRVPAAGLLARAEALAAEVADHGDVVPAFALAELAAVAGQVERGVIDAARVYRPPDLPLIRDQLNGPTYAFMRHIACAAAAQGRIDEALAITEPCHALVMASGVGGHLTAALAMATGIATEQAARRYSQPVAVHRRDIVINLCTTLAGAGMADRVVEAALTLPPRYRDAALRMAGLAALEHGYAEAGLELLWLVGGSRSAVAEVAIADLAAGLAVAETIGKDIYSGRERAFLNVATIAASRGLLAEAGAAVARIPLDSWALSSAWRNIAGRLDEADRQTFAAAYLTARGV